MRENKFRVWDVTDERMYYNVTNISDINGYIMQYTGVKDVNGRDIYEGDVVQFLDVKEIVSFDCDCVGYKPFVNDMGCGCCSASDTGLPPEDTKVIGNIYENPELMDDASS